MTSPSLAKQRPSRERAPPQRFKDFVMNMVNELMIKYYLDCDHIKGEVLEPLPEVPFQCVFHSGTTISKTKTHWMKQTFTFKMNYELTKLCLNGCSYCSW